MDFQAVAAQLRQPQGDFGKRIGENMNVSNALMNRMAIQHLNLQAEDRVLEIGMGNGAFCHEILESHPDIHYTGCDFSETMVAEATERNQKWIDAGRVRFLLADAAEMPLPTDYFTNVLTINTIYFWQDASRVLNQIWRVLEPAGKLIIGIRSRDVMQHLPFTSYGFRMYTAGEVKQLLLANGFSSIEIQEIEEPAQEIDGQSYSMDSVLISGRK
jgi:ubiquinone/menaquinone biosynthesis C-methylase UbiE